MICTELDFVTECRLTENAIYSINIFSIAFVFFLAIFLFSYFYIRDN